MKEVVGDLFAQSCDAICITTNHQCKGNGQAVMGAGVAKSAAQLYPLLPLILGQFLSETGDAFCLMTGKNKDGADEIRWQDSSGFFLFTAAPYAIVSLPTKKHWRDPSDLNLIELSVKRLVQLSDERSWTKVYLTRPGCGNGGLEWEKQVRPLIEPLLDNRFYVITPK